MVFGAAAECGAGIGRVTGFADFVGGTSMRFNRIQRD
jgi:hypothetical protein